MKSSTLFFVLSEEKDSLLDFPNFSSSPLCFVMPFFRFFFFPFFLSLVYNKYTQQQKSAFCYVGCATNVVNIFIKCHALHDVTENLLLRVKEKKVFSSSDCKVNRQFLPHFFPLLPSKINDDLFISGAFFFKAQMTATWKKPTATKAKLPKQHGKNRQSENLLH